MKCHKHPHREAISILEKHGDRFFLCVECERNVLKRGDEVLCVGDGSLLRWDRNGKAVFRKGVRYEM